MAPAISYGSREGSITISQKAVPISQNVLQISKCVAISQNNCLNFSN